MKLLAPSPRAEHTKQEHTPGCNHGLELLTNPRRFDVGLPVAGVARCEPECAGSHRVCCVLLQRQAAQPSVQLRETSLALCTIPLQWHNQLIDRERSPGQRQKGVSGRQARVREARLGGIVAPVDPQRDASCRW